MNIIKLNKIQLNVELGIYGYNDDYIIEGSYKHVVIDTIAKINTIWLRNIFVKEARISYEKRQSYTISFVKDVISGKIDLNK